MVLGNVAILCSLDKLWNKAQIRKNNKTAIYLTMTFNHIDTTKIDLT